MQGPPTPGPQTDSGPWLVRNLAAQQEVSIWLVTGSFICIYRRSPVTLITTWAPPPVRS